MSTAPDTAWIVALLDVDPAGVATEITQGYLRAGLRTVDDGASRPGAPARPCRTFVPVPVSAPVSYRVPLVPNARRFAAGHRVRLVVTGDDQGEDKPAMMAFRHASVGTSCVSDILSSSQLLVPLLPPVAG